MTDEQMIRGIGLAMRDMCEQLHLQRLTGRTEGGSTVTFRVGVGLQVAVPGVPPLLVPDEALDAVGYVAASDEDVMLAAAAGAQHNLHSPHDSVHRAQEGTR